MALRRFIAVVVLFTFLPLAFSGCAGTTDPISKSGKPKFVRIPSEGIFGGVAAGVAYYFGWNITLVRIVWAVAIFVVGIGAGVYIIMWILMPAANYTPADYGERTGGK